MSVVLVTDGDQRSTLAVARSLGRQGHAVHVTSPSGRSLAGASRFVRSDSGVGRSDAPDYGPRVVTEARAVGADHVIPTTEASIRALAPRAAELPGGGIPMLDAEAFERVSDKRVVLDAARAVGIPTPRQRVLEAKGDVEAARELATETGGPGSGFPLFVKPSRSVAPPDPAGVRLANPGARRVRGPDELGEVVASTPDSAFPLLVQEEIPGVGAGVFVLMDRHDVLAAFAHRRVREKPPSGGVSVCRETGRLDPELLEMSRALLERLGWRGVAMVEYRIDARDGRPVLMEVNGRFWGSLQLAIDAGVDFPALLLDRVEGRPLPPVTTEWRDVRLRWLWGEADHVWARFRRPPPGRTPLREGLAALGEVLVPSLRDRTEILRLGDPGPFLRESGARFVGGVGRLTRGGRRRRLP